MMTNLKSRLIAALTLPLLTAFPLIAKAEPLTAATVPATAKWVMHFDMDAARDTKLWDLVQTKIIAQNQAAFDAGVNHIEAATGLKFPRDLHDVTLWGPSFDKDDAAILIHAAANQEKILDLLKRNPEFRSTAHNDHDILSWRDNDKDRIMYGAFHGPDKAIIAATQKLVETALDALDKKIDVLKDDSPLAPQKTDMLAKPTKQPALILFVAGQGLQDLNKVQNPATPLLVQTDSGMLSLAEIDQKIIARVAVKTRDEKAAKQVHALATGMKAMLALFAADEKADQKVKAAASALEPLMLQLQGSNVEANLSISIDELKNLIEMNRPRVVREPDAPAKKPDLP